MPENVNTSALYVENYAADVADDRPVMISVDHVSMSFNMASEQLNNLKEYAISIARRKLFFKELKALDDVSFEVRKGDVFGILGTNGSGKSTMLKVIAGVLEPSKGSCQVNGNIAPLIELGAGFDMDLSARENIYLNGSLLGYSRSFIDQHFDDIVEFAEVETFLDMPMKNYSSGMVSRIAFAIATVIVPEILLVDEVLSVGDFMFQKKCEDRIKQLINEYGVTVLIVSHSNEQIARLCNKAIWIEKGHTRLLGDARMVGRAYGGLGGRVGSRESEETVFDAINRSLTMEKIENYYEGFSGESVISTNAKVVTAVWDDDPMDTVLLACEDVHINAVTASALAGALGAPVLAIKSTKITDAVERILYEKRPSTIVVVDVNNQAKIATSALEELPWQPSVVRIDKPGSASSFSRDVIEYGVQQGLWGKALSVIAFDDNTEAFAVTPLLYRERCPIVVTHGDEGEELGEAIAALYGGDAPEVVYSFGLKATDQAARLAKRLGAEHIAVGDCALPDSCLEIASFVFEGALDAQPGDARPLYATSQSLSQWPLLLSTGSAAGSENSAVLRIDTTSLDNIAAALRFISSHSASISGLSFVGDTGLSEAERELLCAALDESVVEESREKQARERVRKHLAKKGKLDGSQPAAEPQAASASDQ